MHKHIVDTPVGIFRFFWVSHERVGKFVKKKNPRRWIAGQFDNPKSAGRYYDCNPFSGKYNFHGWYGGTPMAEFKTLMENFRNLKEKSNGHQTNRAPINADTLQA